MHNDPMLALTNIGKRYGTHQVLFPTSLRLLRGESVAVIGENGAGKSTFAKIISGVIRPDSGSMWLEGRPLAFTSPRDALRAGIALIPQELAYVAQMSVADNMLLGRWPHRFGLTTRAAAVVRARAICTRFGIALDPARSMARLKVADRQIVEILKALSRDARVIVLDEPTASLSEQESHALFDILGRLTRDGVGILYISHRMDEVFRFSDRVLVFRNGQMVADAPTRETTQAALIGHMLGAEKEPFVSRSAAPPAAPAAVTLGGWRREGIPALAGVSLTVDRGSVVGLYGLRGSGAELVAEGLAGLHADIEGTLTLDGRQRAMIRHPRAARRHRIATVPAERKRDGLILIRPIRENLVLLVLGRLSRAGIVRRRRERALAAELVRRFDVRSHGMAQPVGRLSGGNQQKVLLASRLAAEPRLLVLQEPTRGVDIGARVDIHRLLIATARAGAAILMVTADVEEAVAVSDRLLVMREGRIAGELAGASKTQVRAIALAAGEAA